MSDIKCYVCGEHFGSFGSPLHALTITMECFDVGSTVWKFHVCRKCGSKVLIAFSQDPFPQKEKL